MFYLQKQNGVENINPNTWNAAPGVYLATCQIELPRHDSASGVRFLSLPILKIDQATCAPKGAMLRINCLNHTNFTQAHSCHDIFFSFSSSNVLSKLL